MVRFSQSFNPQDGVTVTTIEERQAMARRMVTSKPLTDEQRRGLTRIAMQYARRKRQEASLASAQADSSPQTSQ